MTDYKKICNLVKTLPDDIIREHIIPYTFQIQPKNLCDDIKSYYSVKTHLHELYYNRWKDTFYYEENADINWLSNDMTSFFNENVATINGYTANHLKKWRRLFIFQDKSDLVIIDFLNKYNHRKCITDINLCLGVLTKFEREEFIQLFSG
jgi:hypothetical protein